MRLIDADALTNRIVFHTDLDFDTKEAVEDEIQIAPTIGGWIPVTERLPETEEDFLCIDADENCEVGCYSQSFKHFFFDSCSDIGKPIAWMPLPEPYRKDGEK